LLALRRFLQVLAENFVAAFLLLEATPYPL